MAMGWYSAEMSLWVLPGMSLDVFLNRFPPLCETSRISLGTPLGLGWSQILIHSLCMHPADETSGICFQQTRPWQHNQNVRIQSADTNMPINQPVAGTAAARRKGSRVMRQTYTKEYH